MQLKNSLTDYTQEEFMELLDEIFIENVAPTDERLDVLLEHFEKITEHPDGSDLIYYPESDAEGTPEAVTRKVKAWRAANGRPGFKTV